MQDANQEVLLKNLDITVNEFIKNAIELKECKKQLKETRRNYISILDAEAEINKQIIISTPRNVEGFDIKPVADSFLSALDLGDVFNGFAANFLSQLGTDPKSPEEIDKLERKKDELEIQKDNLKHSVDALKEQVDSLDRREDELVEQMQSLTDQITDISANKIAVDIISRIPDELSIFKIKELCSDLIDKINLMEQSQNQEQKPSLLEKAKAAKSDPRLLNQESPSGNNIQTHEQGK
jgi:hypothetical protein